MNGDDARGTEPALRRIHPQALKLFRLQAVVRAVVYGALAVGAVAAFPGKDTSLWLWLLPTVVGGGAIAVAALYPPRAFAGWGYSVREHDLLVVNGVFFRHSVSIPAGRIQHVDVEQGPLERWLRLSRVRIFTASGMRADGVIPGLAPEVAAALREQLVRREALDVV